MAVEHCEYRHVLVRDGAEACRVANREMWDLVSVVNNPSPHLHNLIAFYRVPLQ